MNPIETERLELMSSRLRELDDQTYSDKNRRRALKLALVREYGVCFWCSTEVKDYGLIREGEKTPRDMATVDHIVSRLGGRRKGERVLKVLACEPCNTKRSRSEQKAYRI